MLAEDLQDKAIAYILGEMDETERAAFESQLGENAELKAYVEGLEGIDSELTIASTELQTPPESLGARIVNSLPEKKSATPQGTESTTPPESGSTFLRFPIAATLGWAAAACFCILFFRTDSRLESVASKAEAELARNDVLTSRVEQLQTDLDTLAQERDLIAQDLVELKEKSALDQIQIARLNSELDSLYFGFTVWDGENKEGVVRVYNLPTLDFDSQDYQMWVISPNQPAPISAGVFQVDQLGNGEYRFEPNAEFDGVNAFAISREKKGGSSSPEGPILLSGSP